MARSYYSTIFEQSADEPVRNVLYQSNRIRQKLLAMSDVERSQTYEFAEARTIPGQNYRATLRLTPVVDGDRTFVEWWATFDCKPERRDERVALFRESFARWLGSLRRKLDAQSAVC
jgi:Polyketide cyclase / dehydrase and lipid transport